MVGHTIGEARLGSVPPVAGATAAWRAETAQCHHGHACNRGCRSPFAGTPKITARPLGAAPPRHGGHDEQGHINRHHHGHGRHEVVEQLHGLAGIGGDEVEKHVDGYHATPVKEEQNELEGCEKDERKAHPHGLAGLAAQCDQQRIHRHGQQHIGRAGPPGHVFGGAEGHIGQGEGCNGVGHAYANMSE